MIYNAKMSMKDRDNCLDNCTAKPAAIERTETTPLLNDKTLIALQQLAKNCDENYGKFSSLNKKSGYEEIVDKKLQLDDNEDDDSFIMNNCFCSLILSPVYIVFWATMPKRWPIWTFIVSIAYLTGLSYGTVWAISGFSDALSIPHTVSGMTLLAAGSAVPDLVTSIIVIKKHGLASMGMCAAIASNIFAIVVGLGLPWLLKCLIQLYQTNGDYSMAFIPIESDALPYTSIVLLITIFALLLSLKLCDWRLYTTLSLICALIHLIFMGASISLELFVHS
ncbi:unnamed protein product [Medioppia subpectinata]|uniref:Sodium/calcium exchanger membrane region domain-containing protein n=1 Tax=Medioppia subpectinata TaxID=1979941 RepID=A0A7R9L6X6_9ACAR|nr:unnamed protein product [Medioppia subpectinata]CAG2116454.1 unnamed protein product [Medioppia subpectinata]